MTVIGYIKLGSSSSTWSPINEDDVKKFLYENGPLAIDLNFSPLQTYTSGIFDLTKAQYNPDSMNHAATLVGYGTDEKLRINYWISKTHGEKVGEKVDNSELPEVEVPAE